MRNVAYLLKTTGMSFKDVMDMPYISFLPLLINLRELEVEDAKHQYNMFEVQQTRQMDQHTYNDPLYETEPDWNAVRKYIGKGVGING